MTSPTTLPAWQTLTELAAGTTSVLLRLPTTDDALKESPEDFTLTATPVSGAAPTPATATPTNTITYFFFFFFFKIVNFNISIKDAIRLCI